MFSGSGNGRSCKGRAPSLNAYRVLALALMVGGAAQAEPFFWNPSTALLNGSADVGASANWSDSANGGGKWPKSGFDDDFTNDALNSIWKLRDADNEPTTSMPSLTAPGNADQLTLTGRGTDVWMADNQYMAVYREDIKGDFDVSVDVVSLSNTDSWAKAGIMMANDYLDFTKGGCFSVLVSAAAGVKVQFDSMGVVGEHDFPLGNGVAGAAPLSLRVARKGGVFYGYWKKNKSDPWILLRTGVPAGAKAANSQIGLFMTSHNVNATGTAVFDNFQASGPILANNLDMTFKGTTTTANANALLNSSLTAQTLDMAGYTGTFAFGASTLTLTGAKADFGITASIDAGTGSLAFSAGSGVTQVFTPAKAGSVFPPIAKSGAGTVQAAVRSINAGLLTLSAGVFDLGNLTHEFTGLAASNGAFTGLGAGDTLILSGDADFSGVSAMPSNGNIQIRAKSTASASRNVLFTPGSAFFTNVYLWAIGAAGFPARITVAPGTLRAKGNLILRDELLASGLRGTLDFQTHNVTVSVDGNIQRVENGSGGTPSQQLLMGGGTWTCKGNVNLSFQNAGSADLSILDLAGASPAVQTLTIANGSLAQVKHSGSGTLNLGSALNAAGLEQTAGVLNFDGNNVAVTGNISVTNGGSTTFIGLGGRTLSAGGAITLAGTAGNLLNLNPGANWNVSSGGGVSADFAAIANSAVIGVPDGNATSACKDQGGNIRWIFAPLTTPPDIITQPVDVTVRTGARAEFTVAAVGAPGITYRWKKRGDAGFSFDGQTLVIDPAAASDSGSLYYCTARNDSGEAVTRDAMLNVNDPAHFLVHPASISVVADDPATFKVSAKGSGKLEFKWKRKGDTANTIGTDSVFTLAKATVSQNGWTYFCIVSNLYGEAVSTEAVLTVNTLPAIGTQPRDTVVLAGRSARFTVAATGSPDLAYQWYRKGDSAKLAKTPTLTVSTAAGDDTARYYCVVTNPFGEAVSYAAKLTVGVVPVITLEPADSSALAGAPASFKLRAIGSPVLGYSWKRVDSALPLTGDSVLSFASVAFADSGSRYFCIVANGHGSDTSVIVTLRVNRPAAIAREPLDTAVVAGQGASFRVGATGSGKLEFAWRKKGDTTVVSRDSLLNFVTTALTDNGALFVCTVSNPYGTVSTREAKLTVVQAALITREPADLFVGLGKKAVFTVGAIGAKPMDYKWRRGADTAGISNDSVYTLDSVKLSDDGLLFNVIVKNGFGADTSRQARLNVVVCDSVFGVTPETLTVDEGRPVVLMGTAACAQNRFWSVVEGPAPRILDPAVDTLRLTAPRVEADTLMVFRFTADYGGDPVTKEVAVKIRNAVPDPLFTLPAKSSWNGSSPFKLKPALTNAADLAQSPYAPAFHYQWFLSIPIVDTVQSADTLILKDPVQDGILEVTLCLDNGGAIHCAVSQIDVDRKSVRLAGLRPTHGRIFLAGNRISWNSPARVRVSDWQGRLLWDRRGRPGESAELPPSAVRSLRSRTARLEILP